jgi:hypothetical protein
VSCERLVEIETAVLVSAVGDAGLWHGREDFKLDVMVDLFVIVSQSWEALEAQSSWRPERRPCWQT